MATGTQMTTAETREVIDRYRASKHTDVSMFAEDATLTVMATGQVARGRDEILGTLTYFYRQAFDAHVEERQVLVEGEHAFAEATFVGRHIGDFNGIPATGRDVRVPLAVAYDLRDGLIREGRVYFEIPALLAQLGMG